jgi:SH3 domain
MRQRLNEDRDSIANSSFLGSSTDGSDHGYTLKRYLLETETVLGDSPSFGLATSELEPPLPDPADDQSLQPLLASSALSNGPKFLQDAGAAISTGPRQIIEWLNIDKNDVPPKGAQRMQRALVIDNSETAKATAGAVDQLLNLPSTPNRNIPLLALDYFHSADQEGTQILDELGSASRQQHSAEAFHHPLAMIDRERRPRNRGSRSTVPTPKVLPHGVGGHSELHSQTWRPMPDTLSRKPDVQPHTGQTSMGLLEAIDRRRAKHEDPQDQVESGGPSARISGGGAARTVGNVVETQRSKAEVSFGVLELIPDPSSENSDSDDDHEKTEPDEQPASSEHGSLVGSNQTSENVEGPYLMLESPFIEDKYPDFISNSPPIDEEDIDFEFVYALHTFVATKEDQTSATKGDKMILLDDSLGDWWLVRLVNNGNIGYLPAEHIETPIERLSRLNKSRNMDLTFPMLGDISGIQS